MWGHVFIFFSFIISSHSKFTGTFDVILVNCDDVYWYCTVFVVLIFGRIASKKRDFYYVEVAKLRKSSLIYYI